MSEVSSPRWLQGVCAVLGVLVLLLTADYLRLSGSSVFDAVIRLESQFYFALMLLLLPLAFLLYRRWFWLDLSFAAIAVASCGYLFVNAEQALDEAWEFGAPDHVVVVALVLWLLVLEALRRAGGIALCLIATCFSILPLVTEWMPGPLSGLAASWQETAAYHALSIESIFGLPFQAFATLVIGFVLFGVVLQQTGGGAFFLNLAFAILGRQRGGPAKVAIVSSGLMGSMSGSVVTNVLTTGQLTIPAMQRSGMRGSMAAGVEACASTGGVLLPPIMGSTAFVMATLLEIPYSEVALAAAVPALLYFISLYLQIDAYAGRVDLQGLAADEVPNLRATLAEGWYYLAAFALLIFLLLFLQREAHAPFYATAALLAVNQFSATYRLNWSGVLQLSAAFARLLAELTVILAGVGLIVGALSLTGLSGTLVNDLLSLAGEELILLLLMGALTSFVLGIGMTVTAAYIFLAIVLAPALVGQNMLPISAHLFILYWAMLSFITPPVALGAFAAASIAGSKPLETGLTAMRLGSVIYLLPFIFVLDSAYLLQQGLVSGLLAALEAVAGIWLIAGALQGYMTGVGAVGSVPIRLTIGIGGLLIALPTLELVSQSSPSNVIMAVAGGVLALGSFVYLKIISN